jgi:hypothetical protein
MVPNPIVSAPRTASHKLLLHHAGIVRRLLAQQSAAAIVSRDAPRKMKVGCRASRVSIQYHNVETWA